VSFIILYPTFIAVAFFLILLKKREVLFGPMDFADPRGFENILLRGFQRIEAKQEAATIDINTALNDVYRTIDKLLELNDVWTAVQVGRSYLQQNEYDKSLQIFKYMLDKVSPKSSTYYKILANAAFSMIGTQDYPGAIDYLRKVESIDRGRQFWSWHSLALAYAYFQTNDFTKYREYLNKAKKIHDDDGYELDIDFFCGLYPEIEKDLRKLWD
jgi:tetratricopeptide (TPR) repeat protein